MGKYNEKELLIMQFNDNFNDWEDVTAKIQWYEAENNACRVKYCGSDKFYFISWSKIKVLNNPQIIDVSNKIIYHKGNNLTDVVLYLKYDNWCKIFYKSGLKSVYKIENIRFINDRKNDKDVKGLLDYLKEISKQLSVEDGKDFLYNQLAEMTVLENSLLAKFISGKMLSVNDDRAIIFPFSTNLSQKKAVCNAIINDLSIIQGPPGTGKTQTILNIIANYVERGQNIAVLSGNNEATKNVEEKISKEGYSYINAVLGNSDNVNAFFAQENIAQVISGDKLKTNKLELSIQALEDNIDMALKCDVEAAKLSQLIEEYKVEKEINDAEYNIKEHIIPTTIQKKQYTSQKFLELASILEVLPNKKISGFFNRARLLFRYGILKVQSVADNQNDIVEYLKNRYYECKIEELNKEENEKVEFLKTANTQELYEKQTQLSKLIFNQSIINRYFGASFNEFTKYNYKNVFSQFVKRYPVVYSTTHAIRSCTGSNFLYDCIIIDEVSQVDLVSAIIAFSCARKVVLVGDEKQITHVVKSNLLPYLEEIFIKSNLSNYFNYTKNNILDCVIKRFPKIPNTMLNEHYRCDPQIIGFCNKRFYNNELVIKTKHQEGNGVTIIKHGSHFERERENEREVDIIDNEIVKEVLAADAGIVSPYRNQVTLLNDRLFEYGFAIDTIHKFQGREKDIIILSTVANKIKFYDDERSDFLNNPNLINVAISRAKKKLYILASEEVLNQEGTILRDLSKYYEYYCDETKILSTNVYSVFDLMYDDYSPILIAMEKKLLKISEWRSENIIATVIDEICKEGKCGALAYKFNFPLKYIIKARNLVDEEDIKFVNNMHTHCDFILFSNLDKKVELVVEVDGSQHKETIQLNRDSRKDRLLKAAGIKIVRLSTTTIDCKEKIINAILHSQ